MSTGVLHQHMSKLTWFGFLQVRLLFAYGHVTVDQPHGPHCPDEAVLSVKLSLFSVCCLLSHAYSMLWREVILEVIELTVCIRKHEKLVTQGRHLSSSDFID